MLADTRWSVCEETGQDVSAWGGQGPLGGKEKPVIPNIGKEVLLEHLSESIVWGRGAASSRRMVPLALEAKTETGL